MKYHDFLIDTDEDIVTFNAQLERFYFHTGVLGLLGLGQATLVDGYPVVRVFGEADADHFERTAPIICSCRIVARLPPGDEEDIFQAFWSQGKKERSMETSRVLISSSVAGWIDGHGRLFTDLFASEQHNDDYAILQIATPQDIPHARPGFYFLTAAEISEAETSGIVLTDVVGDRFGFLLPGEPAASLEAAASAEGNFPLSHDLPLDAWKTDTGDSSYEAFQLARLQRFLIVFAIFLTLYSVAACIVGVLLTGSWYALSSLSSLFVSALLFWHAHPMSEKTYLRNLRKIREKAQPS